MGVERLEAYSNRRFSWTAGYMQLQKEMQLCAPRSSEGGHAGVRVMMMMFFLDGHDVEDADVIQGNIFSLCENCVVPSSVDYQHLFTV
jgi:hypothetical protein